MSESKNNDMDTKVQKTCQRLADVSLRTSATTLTILFAFTFAYATKIAMGYKIFIVGVGLALLASIFLAIMCLYGIDASESRFIKLTAYLSTALMGLAMIFAFLLLVVALFAIF